MTKYIDKTRLMKKIHTGMTILDAMREIIDAPAADVVERKPGHWDFTYGYPRCSQCHAYLGNDEYENHTMKYCYYCGAAMSAEYTNVPSKEGGQDE